MIHRITFYALFLLGGLSLTVRGGTVFEYTFSTGGSASLQGVAPQVRPQTEVFTMEGESASIQAGGTIAGVASSQAYLPFTPVSGQLYELSLKMELTSQNSGGWVGLSFAEHTTTTTGNGLDYGQRGMLLLRDNGAGQMLIFPPYQTRDQNFVSALRNATLQIRLDTRNPIWSVEYRIDDQQVGYILYEGSNPSIHYIGIGKSGAVAARFLTFRLVNDPVTAAVLPDIFVSSPTASADGLAGQFRTPSREFGPWTYYFVENGSADSAGVTADMEALARVGYGGIMLFHEHRDGMPVGSIQPFSPEFRALHQHILAEAGRVGLQVIQFNCHGSSTAGGPWNPVERSMKRVVWREVQVAGGGSPVLSQPLTVEGFYRDIAVLAYPLGHAVQSSVGRGNGLQLTTSPSEGSLANLQDDDLGTHLLFRGVSSQASPREIRFEYAQPIAIAKYFLYSWLFNFTAPVESRLESRNEATGAWTEVARGTQNGDRGMLAEFSSVTAKNFRILIHTGVDNFWIGEAGLYGAGEVPTSYHQFADYGQITGLDHGPLKPFIPTVYGGEPPLGLADAMDLTTALRPDGSLAWTAPEGTAWRVLRIGYTSTGHKNHPSTAGGEGFEVDKFDAESVGLHFDNAVLNFLGTQTPPALVGWYTDSWECRGQTWTETLPTFFQEFNGYPLAPYLPVLAGKIVDSSEKTQKFLEDFRRTQQEMLARNFVDVMAQKAAARGQIYAMQSPAQPVAIVDPSLVLPRTGLWGGESWQNGNFMSGGSISAGQRDATSLGALTGRRVIFSETWTSHDAGFGNSPAQLRLLADTVFAMGATRLVAHAYLSQPSNGKLPGWTMLNYGSSLNRNVTWWEESAPFVQSQSRKQVILQQGDAVVDIVKVRGPEELVADVTAETVFTPPVGFRNLWTSEAGLAASGAVKNGQPRWPLMILPEARPLSLAFAEKLDAYVSAGGAVLGSRPTRRSGQAGGVTNDAKFDTIVSRLWGASGNTETERSVGSGLVCRGLTPEAVLAKRGIDPDFTFVGAAASAILWTHVRLGDRDAYFLANPQQQAIAGTASFRISHRAPQIWVPETGEVLHPALFRHRGTRTELHIKIDSGHSCFVVFGGATSTPPVRDLQHGGVSVFSSGGASGSSSGSSQKFSFLGGKAGEYMLQTAAGENIPFTIGETSSSTIPGPWNLEFTGVAAPAPLTLTTLHSLTSDSNSQVRHFSGRITYRTTWNMPAGFQATNRAVVLDLGQVYELAQVRINGQDCGIWWQPPFRKDVTRFLQAGPNEIEVAVVNTWVNRLIGDAQLSETARTTWTSFSQYKGTEELRASGLLGPVVLEQVSRVPAAPIFTAGVGIPTGTVGDPFHYTITVTPDPATYPTTYQLTGALPAGLTLNSATGVISGTPTLAEDRSVSVTATNTGGTSELLILQIVITVGAIDPYDQWLALYPGLSNTGGSADADQDGWTNHQEYLFGGNPMVESTGILTVTQSGSQILFTFVARRTGATYTIGSSTTLAVGSWLADAEAQASITDAVDQTGVLLPTDYVRRQFSVVAGTKKFFRVEGSTQTTSET